MATTTTTTESHYPNPQRDLFRSQPLSPTIPTTPTSPLYSFSPANSSTPSLRAFSIRSTASSISKIKGLFARGKSRKVVEEPTLKDLIAQEDEFDFECGGESEAFIQSPSPTTLRFPPPLPNMPLPHVNLKRPTTAPGQKSNNNVTETPTPNNSKSRTIIRMLTTKFTPKSPPSDADDNTRKIHFRPPPAVANSPYSKDARDAALRARGLLPPLRPNKDLSTQEMEQDMHIPIVPHAGSEEGGSSSEGSSETGNPLSAADQIKQEWEKRNKEKNVEKEQRERLSAFKFGGQNSSSPTIPPPNLPLPGLPSSDHLFPSHTQENADSSSIQAYMFPLPPSPAPSSYSKTFSTSPPSAFTIPDPSVRPHEVELLDSVPPISSPRPLPTPPAISLTPPAMVADKDIPDPVNLSFTETVKTPITNNTPTINDQGLDVPDTSVPALSPSEDFIALPIPVNESESIPSSAPTPEQDKQKSLEEDGLQNTPAPAMPSSSLSIPQPSSSSTGTSTPTPATPTTTTQNQLSKQATRAQLLQLQIQLGLIKSGQQEEVVVPVVGGSDGSISEGGVDVDMEGVRSASMELGVVVESEEEEEEGVEKEKAKVEEEDDKDKETPSVLTRSDAVSPAPPLSSSELTTQPSTLVPVRRPPQRGLTDPSSSVNVSNPPPPSSSSSAKPPLPPTTTTTRKSLNPFSFKRGHTIAGQHGHGLTVSSNNNDENNHPAAAAAQRRPSIMAKVGRSVVGTITSASSSSSSKKKDSKKVTSPTRVGGFVVDGLPSSPTGLTAESSLLSPPLPTSTSPPTSPQQQSQFQFQPQRRPSQQQQPLLSRQQSQGGMRQAVAPIMYNRGSILLETAGIEDEETRRMTELAFLG